MRVAPDGDGTGAGISKIMFFACLSHSQATAYLLQRMQGGLVVNDVERSNTYYRTTPRGVEYLSTLNMMCELLQTETKAPET